MEADEELQCFIQSTWKFIQSSVRDSDKRTGNEFQMKVQDTKKKITEIIKEIEKQPTKQCRIVSICAPDGTTLPSHSTSISDKINQRNEIEKMKNGIQNEIKPHVDFYEDDDQYDEFNWDTMQAENSTLEGVRIVGVCDPDGTPLPLQSFSKSDHDYSQDYNEKQKRDKQKSLNFYWDDCNASEFYDDYTEYLNEKKEKETLRHLYRLLYWLDFISSGFNCDKQYLRHF